MQNLSEPFLQQICNMDNALYNSEKDMCWYFGAGWNQQ